jgi:hypothetical protein
MKELFCFSFGLIKSFQDAFQIILIEHAKKHIREKKSDKIRVKSVHLTYYFKGQLCLPSFSPFSEEGQKYFFEILSQGFD